MGLGPLWGALEAFPTEQKLPPWSEEVQSQPSPVPGCLGGLKGRGQRKVRSLPCCSQGLRVACVYPHRRCVRVRGPPLTAILLIILTHSACGRKCSGSVLPAECGVGGVSLVLPSHASSLRDAALRRVHVPQSARRCDGGGHSGPGRADTTQAAVHVPARVLCGRED